MNTLLQQLSDEINARGYSEQTLKAYLAANEHLIRYFDQPITTISDEALSAYFKHLKGVKVGYFSSINQLFPRN